MGQREPLRAQCTKRSNWETAYSAFIDAHFSLEARRDRTRPPERHPGIGRHPRPRRRAPFRLPVRRGRPVDPLPPPPEALRDREQRPQPCPLWRNKSSWRAPSAPWRATPTSWCSRGRSRGRRPGGNCATTPRARRLGWACTPPRGAPCPPRSAPCAAAPRSSGARAPPKRCGPSCPARQPCRGGSCWARSWRGAACPPALWRARFKRRRLPGAGCCALPLWDARGKWARPCVEGFALRARAWWTGCKGTAEARLAGEQRDLNPCFQSHSLAL